jgi:molybdopterin-binding protein
VRKIAVSPKDIYVSTERPPGPALNRFKGKIIELTHSSGLTWMHVQVGTHTLLVEQTTEVVEEMNVKVGDEVYVILRLRWLRILSERTSA